MKTQMMAALLAGSALTISGAFADVAMAQDAPAQTDFGVSEGDIVVTARRREESLAHVPIAISVIGKDDIIKRAILSENDLQSAVPGLVIRQNGGASAFNYSIRGQSVDTFTNSPPSVLPYVNEVQIVSHSASTFYDMGGIQVLKGPQGTLFGRNTTGGAVLYTTAQPEDTFGGYASARYGSFKNVHLEGAVNLPISDKAALRVAGSFNRGGAYVRDYFTGEKYGDLDQQSVRVSLKLSPSDRFTNTTIVQYTDEDGTNVPYQLWSTNPCGSSVQGLVDDASCALSSANPVFSQMLAARPELYQGGLDQAIALQRQLGPWKSLSNVPPLHDAWNVYAINTTTAEISDSLTLKNIVGFSRAKSDDTYDYDGSPYTFFETQGLMPLGQIKSTVDAAFLLNTSQMSEELQLQGKALDDRLDFVVGFYYLNQIDRVVSNLDFGDFSPIQPSFHFTYTAKWQSESMAGFAQATMKATDKLSLTGGFRYTHDKTTIRQLPGSLWLSLAPDNTPERTSASKPSWTVSADYKVTPELMLYVAHRGSWRAGGYNYSVFPANVTAASGGNLFTPETTKDVEAGFKYSGSSLGIPITLNADVFNQWVKNIQRSAYILTSAGVSLLTANVPRARITGAEADISIRPASWLTLGGSVNYTHARYTRNEVSILGSTLEYGPFADVPKWSGTAYAEVTVPMGEAGDLALRGDYYGQKKMAFSNVAATANPNTILPGYSLVNLRLTWDHIMGTGLAASAYVRNLTNEKYWVGGNAASAGGNTNVVNPGVKRAFGGELRYRF